MDDNLSPTIPSAVRRLGRTPETVFSSRGLRTIGEPVEAPRVLGNDDSAEIEPPLTLGDPRDAEQQANGLRRRYTLNQRAQATAEKAQADLEKRTRNASREAEFRSRGQKFYTDSFGELQPVLDESGQPQFATTPWKKTKDEASGQFTWARRGEQGQTETRTPKIVTSGDVKDPNLYYDFESQGREPVGHVDDLANHADPEIAREAAAYRLKRNAALRKESLAPLQKAHDAAAADLESAQLRQSQLDDQIATLSQQIGGIEAAPAFKATQGGFLGVGAEPTEEAARLQRQRAELAKQLSALSQQRDQLALATDPKDGPLTRKAAAAKLELEAWSHQSKLGELDDLATQRRVWLRNQNRSEKDDPVLGQILAKQTEFGEKLSKVSQQRQAEADVIAQGRAAGDAAEPDPQAFSTAADAFGKKVADYTARLDDFKAKAQTGATDDALHAEALAIENDRRALLGERERLAAWSGKISATRAKEALSVVSDLERDRDSFKPDFFVGHWSKWFTGEESRARDERMASLRRDAGAAFSDEKVSALGTAEKVMNYVGAIVSTPIDAIRGRTLADVQAQERHDQAKQLIGDFKGADALRVVKLQGDYADRLARGEPLVRVKEATTGNALRQFTTADSLESLQSLRDVLKADDGTSPMLGSLIGGREISRSVLQVASLINALPGVNVDFQTLGVNTRDPEAFAKHAVLARAVAEQIQRKYPNSALAGMVAGSLDQFIGMNAIAAPVAARGAVAGKRTAAVAALGGVKLAAERASLWLASAGVGASQSYYENPSMGFAARWVDVLGNTIPLAVGEATGNRLEHTLTRRLPATLSGAKVVASTAARIGGGTAGEITSDIVQNLVQGQPFDDQLRGMLEGNLGAVLGMALIRGAGEAMPLKHARDYAARITSMRAELNNRLADVRAVIDEAKQQTPEGERARAILAAIPAGAVDNFEQVVGGLPAGPVDRAKDLGQLRAQNAQRLGRMLVAGSYAETLQHRIADTFAALAQIDRLPDYFQIDPQTGQPMHDPRFVGANRDAARALVKITNGVVPERLTEAEHSGLQAISNDLGSQMVREVNGRYVLTDKARTWVIDTAPAVARLIRSTEAEQIAQADQPPAEVARPTATSQATGRVTPSAEEETPIAEDLRQELQAQTQSDATAPLEPAEPATPGAEAAQVAATPTPAESTPTPPAPGSADEGQQENSPPPAAPAVGPSPSTAAGGREFQLPADLRGAKPRFSYGKKQFTVSFESELDKALYILAQPSPSKRDADFARAVTAQTGMSEVQAREAGKTVRDQIKAMARESDAGLLVVPAIHEAGDTAAPSAAAPATPAPRKQSTRPQRSKPIPNASPAAEAREPLAPAQSFKDTQRDLLAKIDAAIAAAHSEADFREQARREAVKEEIAGRLRSNNAENRKRRDAWIETRARELAAELTRTPTVTVRSGNTQFTVRNTAEVLGRLRKLVEKRVGPATNPGEAARETIPQATVVSRYEAAKSEAERRAAIDLMSEATLAKLGLDKKFVRITPGNVMTREAAEKLAQMKRGENAGAFDVEASTPVGPSDLTGETVDFDSGDSTPAKADLTRSHLALADKIADRFRIPGLDAADIRQEARRVLIRAAQSFDPARGEFAPFAGTIIRNRLRDIFNGEVRRVRVHGVSADAPMESGATLLDGLIVDEGARNSAERADARRLLANTLAALPERARAILEARSRGATFAAIAQDHGVSDARVKQIAREAMNAVRAQLADRGVAKLDDVVFATMAGDSESAGVDRAAPAAFTFTTPPDEPRTRQDAEQVGYFEDAFNAGRAPDAPRLRLELRRLDPGYYAEPGTESGGDAARMVLRAHRALEAAFGKKVLFVEPSEPVTWQAATARSRANTILINTRATSPLMALVGHEFGHQIENQAPDLHRALARVVAEVAPMPTSYAAEKRAQGYALDAVPGEWVNDTLGARFDDPQFWREVARVADQRGVDGLNFRDLMQRALDWLAKMGERIKNLLHDQTADPFVRDLDRLRRTAAEVLVEYQRRGPHPDNPSRTDFDSADDEELSTATSARTDTPEFRRWFGASKVLTNEGAPLVVYHGTAENFAAFDPEKIGSRNDSGFLGRGFYFTSDPFVASAYAHGTENFGLNSPRETGQAVIPVFLRIERPFVTDRPISEETAARARQQGHDGIIYRPGGIESDEFVVFSPGQIKSAIGNRGTFDSAEADITRSVPSGTRAESAEASDLELSTPQNLRGEKLAGEWRAFASDSHTLGIPRSKMPQIKSEHRGALVQFLSARGITHTQEEVSPGTLKPTQAEYSPAKVETARKFQGEGRAILVSSDDHVLDGHHQWMAALAGESPHPIRVIRLNAPIRALLPVVADFPSVNNAAGAIKNAPAESKPAPVPGQPGQFYRSTPDSLRERGLDVARQIYARRGHQDAAEVARQIVDHVGNERAAELAVAKGDDGIPGDVRTLIYGELLGRHARSLTDPKTGKAERAQARREIQRLQATKPAQFTERGQEISALQRVYKDVHAATMSQYLDGVRREQDRQLGEPGAKATTDATKVVNEASERAMDQATKELGKALRTVPVTKTVWQRYRDDAANRLMEFVENRVTEEAPRPPLQEFTARVVAEMRARLAAALPAAERAEPPSAIDLLREAIENKSKYADVFATAREAFVKEFGEGSPAVELVDTELANIGVRPYSKRLLDRAIKDAHAAMGTNVADLAREHFTTTDAKAADLADALVKFAGLTGADAKQVAGDLEARAKELVGEARRKALEKLRKQATATPKTRAVLSALEKAVELNNLGALHEADLREVVAKKLGLPTVSADQMNQLATLADRVETAASHAARSRAELELATALRDVHRVGRADLATSIWYANVLSGYVTHARNIFGNLTNGTLQLATVIATNPNHAADALRGWVSGFADGWTDAKSIVTTGRGRRDFDAKTGSAANALERVDYAKSFPNMSAKLAVAANKHAAALRMVGRFMRAADAVFFHANKEAYERVAVAKLLDGEFHGHELAEKIRETLQIAPHHYLSAERQAQAEGYDGLEKALRMADILEERRKATKPGNIAAEGAERFGLESTYNNEPEGWAGVIYHHLAKLTNDLRPGGVPVLKAFLPFLKIPTNVMNVSLNFTPLGAVRAARGVVTINGAGEISRREFTGEERTRLYIQSFGSSLAMAALYAAAMAGADDDDPWFTITATGPSDFRKRDQLRATGWRPHSMKFGNTWVGYKDTPLLIPLAIVGNMVDAKKYQKTRDDLAFGSRAIDATMRGGRVIFDTSMLSGLGNLMDFAQDRASADRVGRFLTRIPADLVVPFSNLLRQIDQTFNPEARQPDGPLGDVGAALPFVRNTGSERVDVLGAPVRSRPTDAFATFETNDALRDLLRRKNVFVPSPDRDTKLGDRVMTPEEFSAFQRARGERLRRELELREPMMRSMLREQVEKIVHRLAREATDEAKERIRRQALREPATR